MRYRLTALSALVMVYFAALLGGVAKGGEGEKGQQQHQQNQNHQQQNNQNHSQPRHQEPRIQQGQQNNQRQGNNPEFQKGAPNKRGFESIESQMGRQKNNERAKNNNSNDFRRGESKDWHRETKDWRNERGHEPSQRFERGMNDYRNHNFSHANERFYSDRHRYMERIVTHERWRTWDHREHVFYERYRVRYPGLVVVYSDGINPYWDYYLLDHPYYLYRWVYHHRWEIDTAHYEYLLSMNLGLAAQIAAWELARVAIIPNYCPPGVYDDVIYSREYIEEHFRR